MMVWCRETLGSSFPALRVGAAMAPNRTTIKETRGDAALFGTISVGAAALEKQTGSIGATLPSSLQDFVVNLHHQRIATLFLNVRKSGWYSFLISRQPTWLRKSILWCPLLYYKACAVTCIYWLGKFSNRLAAYGAVTLKSRALSLVSVPIGWPIIGIIVEDEKNGMRGQSTHPCEYDIMVRKTPACQYP
jgi:hypothetical protein